MKGQKRKRENRMKALRQAVAMELKRAQKYLYCNTCTGGFL